MVRTITYCCNVRRHSDGITTPSVAFLLPIFSRKLLIWLYLFGSKHSVDLEVKCHPDYKNRTQAIADCRLPIADWLSTRMGHWKDLCRKQAERVPAIRQSAIGNRQCFRLTPENQIAYKQR